MAPRGSNAMPGSPVQGGRSTTPFPRRRNGRGFTWAWVVLGVLCGIGLVVLGIRDSHAIDVVVGLAVIAVCVLLSHPSRQAIARRLVSGRPRPDVAAAPVVVYWRADDLNSLRLRGALRDVRNRAVWINNFWDAEGERIVRQYNGGDEVLPMVMINGQPSIDPAPDVVRAAIEEYGAADPADA